VFWADGNGHNVEVTIIYPSIEDGEHEYGFPDKWYVGPVEQYSHPGSLGSEMVHEATKLKPCRFPGKALAKKEGAMTNKQKQDLNEALCEALYETLGPKPTPGKSGDYRWSTEYFGLVKSPETGKLLVGMHRSLHYDFFSDWRATDKLLQAMRELGYWWDSTVHIDGTGFVTFHSETFKPNISCSVGGGKVPEATAFAVCRALGLKIDDMLKNHLDPDE
jgi:hypothetical protein